MLRGGRVAWLLLIAAGCGRLGFAHEQLDSSIADDDGGADDDAAVDDAGMPDAAPACSPAFEICDGFEAAAIDPATWMVDPMVTLDTTRAHRGSQSVRVRSAAMGAGQNQYVALSESTSLMTNSTVFVRGWFWLSALPAGGNGMELITTERPGFGGDYVFVFRDRTDIYTQFDAVSRMTPTAVPIGSWFCLVFKVVRSTQSQGSLELTGDLPPLVMPDVITDMSPPITLVTLGIGFAASNVPTAQPALDVWIDDVIVDGSPVTCAD